MKKSFLIGLALFSLVFSCTNPTTDSPNGGNDSARYRVDVTVDTGGLTLDVSVQARSGGTIVEANYLGSKFVLNDLSSGEWQIQAYGRLFGQNPVFYFAEETLSVNGDLGINLALHPFKVLTPYSNKENNSMVAPGESITLYTSTPGAQIFYTTNGSVPTNTPSSTNFLYDANSPITLTENTTLRVRAFKAGLEPSEVRVLSLLVDNNQSTPPAISPSAGAYQDSVSVSLSAAAGATIRYTTDGSDPDANAPVYTAPFTLTANTTVKARAWESGKSPSPVTSALYTLSQNPVPAESPNFSHAGGNYSQAFSLTLSAPAGSSIRYTTNGSIPDGNSPVYSSPIAIAAGTTTVRALAQAPGKTDSPVVSHTYVVTIGLPPTQPPTPSPLGGTYPQGTQISLSAEPGAVIYYSLDGSEVNESSPTYSGPISLPVGVTTVKARAQSSGKALSSQIQETYTLEATPQEYKLYFHYTGAGTPQAYVWYGNPVVQPFGTWANTQPMSSSGSGWWVADLGAKGVATNQTVGVIFKIGDTKLSGNADLSRTGTGWCRMESGLPVWYDFNPDQPAKPSITLSPNGGFIQSTLTVNVTISENNSPVTSKTYSINGSQQNLTGNTITLDASGLSEGQTLTLIVSATNGVGTTTTPPAVFTKSNVVNPPTTLGALYSPTGTTFRIWSPDRTDVKLYLGGTNGSGGQLYTLAKRSNFSGYTDVYEISIPGDHRHKEYQFRINGVGVRDPYGAMVKPGTNWNIVMDLNRASTLPQNNSVSRPPLAHRVDSVVYEVHVRDFTIHESSGVDAAKRGKFLGMVQTGTRLPGNPSIKTGLDHLVELGVTHVQILPFYDFSTPMYNWGYDPVNYNVPEEQYAMDPNDYDRRVQEVREMIKSFHAAGIRVVMDVVYNHTFSKEMFENITGKYYHPAPTDLSGCGNSIDTSHAMVRRFIRDSLEFWVREYGIDGFRFDLIGVFHYDAVREWGEYLNQQYPDRNLLLYGEPWNGYAADPIEPQRVRLGTVPSLANAHVGVFNPAYRESIKGNNDGTSRGYMFNNGIGQWWGSMAVGMRGSLKAVNNTNNLPNLWDSMYAVNPEQVVNYISAHDNFGLWDKVFLSLSSNVTQNSSHQVLSLTPPANLDYAKRVARFGMGMVVTSQGIPFLHAGDEFLRTKTNNEDMNSAGSWNYGQHGGTHNTYNAPDSFNAIRWTRKASESATFNFIKDLVALRRSRVGLRLQTWDQIKNRMETRLNAGANASGASGVHLVHDANLPGNVFVSYIDEDNNTANGWEVIVVFNSGSNWTLTPPSGTWRKIFGPSGTVNESNLICEGTAVTVFVRQ